MQKQKRAVCYDDALQLEAYHFKGIAQPFPNHFHDYYVIGYIETGTRRLSCKNKEYTIGQGNILLFHPNDNHGCVQCDGETLDYRELNISKEAMLSLAEEIIGQRKLLCFSENVIKNDELTFYFCSLHRMIMDGGAVRNMLILSSGKHRVNLHDGFECRRDYFCRSVFYCRFIACVSENGRNTKSRFFCGIYCRYDRDMPYQF